MREDKKVIEYLKQLNLTDIEADFYLILLKSGPLTVRDLAQMSGIKRTTSYLYIDLLVEKGLAAKLVSGAKKQVAANPPEEALKHLVESKIASAESNEKELPRMLKLIGSMPRLNDFNNTEIVYVKGINTIRNIYEEAFKSGEVRSYVKIEEKALLSDDNSVFFHKLFEKHKGARLREIVYESDVSRRKAMKILSQNQNYSYKFMPDDLKWSTTSEDILIFDERVALINYAGKTSATILKSPGFYHNSKQIFDFLWKLMPEPTS